MEAGAQDLGASMRTCGGSEGVRTSDCGQDDRASASAPPQDLRVGEVEPFPRKRRQFPPEGESERELGRKGKVEDVHRRAGVASLAPSSGVNAR